MRRPRLAALASAVLAVATMAALTTPASAAPPSRDSRLWVNPASSTLQAADSLTGAALTNALTLAAYPSATWFTGGTPDEVRQQVGAVVVQADVAGQVPVLVAYNLPYRDCGRYSTGGATGVVAYQAWIDGFARGIGNSAAIVILEPDGLAAIPWYSAADGTEQDCRPDGSNRATAAAERFAALNHAVEALTALPSAKVYLDGGHSNWLGVGDLSERLIKAGVLRAAGFFLNAGDYQYTANLRAYGRWVSSCITWVVTARGDPDECGDQRWNGGPSTNWVGAAMNAYGQWSQDNPAFALDTAGVDSRYVQQLAGRTPLVHFVIDTSRNGAGPWEVSSGYEGWCNPPDRGLGLRPTLNVDDPLVDAYLWIANPGTSDGACLRGDPGPLDPARNRVDPPAGEWFPEMARELLANAVPPVR
ncbi:MAG: glycoside hydrolase family 6 protein [Propionicimonas sp.]|uniref:glycoside hydrolase family 6 protein n=1 Tax=Propionicimonas sp. TaxID=1955623 RepID=UPI002B207797|nr:glycoside hydrolase family 6 protein [Propionicimonas sp.]MEA4944490.1 glycoside hydrolase family 6 protein [Propionicimonas sp.]